MSAYSTEKCLIENCPNIQTHTTYFCKKHEQDWIHSPERASIRWEEDGHYDHVARAWKGLGEDDEGV